MTVARQVRQWREDTTARIYAILAATRYTLFTEEISSAANKQRATHGREAVHVQPCPLPNHNSVCIGKSIPAGHTAGMLGL
jgi:hypothetical protein